MCITCSDLKSSFNKKNIILLSACKIIIASQHQDTQGQHTQITARVCNFINQIPHNVHDSHSSTHQTQRLEDNTDVIVECLGLKCSDHPHTQH